MPKTPTDASQLLPPDLLLVWNAWSWSGRKIFRGRMKGERKSRRKGQSVEFADFRNYVPAMTCVSSIGTCTLGWIDCS